MRADLSTIQQMLTPEAAAALARAIDEAARRRHGQTTPLHVAAALLAAPAGLLREACARAASAGAGPGASVAHPLQCRALELCFSVALDRLPAKIGAAATHASAPPVSYALVTALDRAQAQQRRGCPEAAQQPLLAVKVELEQLVLSILDDQSVSCVMHEASVSSTVVKTIIEQSLASAAATHASGPPVSNALVAALKRAQVRQRRECPEAAVKVGLEQLILSLLDDPSVSRVMREAAFSSAAVKTTIEQSLASPSTAAAVSTPMVAATTPLAPSPSPLPRVGPANAYINPRLGADAGSGGDDARKVLDVMLNPARHNPVLVGNAGADAVLKEAVSRMPMAGSPALAGAKVLPLEGDLAKLAGDKAAMAARIRDLGAVVQRLLADHGAVVLDLGDLKWLVDGPATAASEGSKAVVSEMARLLRRFGIGKVWAVGTAACATYLRCKVYHPTMEAEWDIQAVPIARSAPVAGAALGNMELNILERIVNGTEKPCHLDLALLQSITDNFSEKEKIGSGGCGIVYKGILQNGIIAVKRLLKIWTIKDNMFHREVLSLISVKHQNIVRLLGYCSITEERATLLLGGRHVMADIWERLLCFEYIRNGSLENHLTDELRGLEWQTRYQIIIGICRGLHYLHEDKGIIHMDLKPSNILLDDLMVPKITDFGLSRPETDSQDTTTRLISRGYTAPEYISGGKATRKSDIYSLGVIIIELVTGSRTEPNITKVIRRWNHRWIKSMKHSPLGYQQVAKCLELALRCIQDDPTNRPDISDIIDELKEIDTKYALTQIQISPCCLEDILGIGPLEIRIPFEDFKVSHSVELTNDTDDYIAFVTKAKLERFCAEPDRGIVPPRSKCSVILVMEAKVNVQPNVHYTEVITVLSTRVDNGALAAMDINSGDIFIDCEEGKVIDEVNVMVVFGTPQLPEEQ